MRALLLRILAAVRRNKAERDLDAEVRFHLQLLADEFEAKGLDSNAARLAARRVFGGVEQAKEAYRDRRGLPLVDGALRDLRHTARSLRRSPGFTTIVVGACCCRRAWCLVIVHEALPRSRSWLRGVALEESASRVV